MKECQLMSVACYTRIKRLIENSYQILMRTVMASGYLEDLEADVFKKKLIFKQ
jgi:hypothetical protein